MKDETFEHDTEEMSEGEWGDLRVQVAGFSPDSIWRKLLAEYDRRGTEQSAPLGRPSTTFRSEERPQIEPYILMDEAGHWAYHMTREELRIIMIALAGFELLKEERAEIRGFYMTLFEEMGGRLKR